MENQVKAGSMRRVEGVDFRVGGTYMAASATRHTQSLFSHQAWNPELGTCSSHVLFKYRKPSLLSLWGEWIVALGVRNNLEELGH